MKIQEAIKSGKPFRRSVKRRKFGPGLPKEGIETPAWDWIVVSAEQLAPQFRQWRTFGEPDASISLNLNVTDVLADDWEVKE